MKRLLLVYNPNSSQYIHVKDEILSRATKVRGYMVGKFTIKKAPFRKNVAALADFLKDGDTVVAAGGDATAAVCVNAILESGKDVVLGVLPYGNFNDLARTLGTMRYEDIFPLGSSKVRKLYPLDIKVDGKHWRYASCYVTMGMTAEAVELFDEPKFRKKMQRGHRSSWRSYLALVKWFFRFRHSHQFIPPYHINGVASPRGVSDYWALSGRSMCRIMKGGDDFLRPTFFRSGSRNLTGFWSITFLMLQSIFARTPGEETSGDSIVFDEPATIKLQAEGEYETFHDVHELTVTKPTSKSIKVFHKGA
ncbi:MAG: hypothetical protein IKG04_05715 [Exiguobacterium sp.]|nr:hypothetical protein [Exiguobacterium sp.]